MKYMLIDITTPETAKVLKIGTLRIVQLFGKIYQAEGRTVIAPPFEGRGFSKVEKLTLQYLYWNTCGETPPDEYAELVLRCKAKLETFPVDATPEVVLEKQVAALAPPPSEERPIEKKQKSTEPSKRPSGMTTTGLVWDIADKLFAANGNFMPDRRKVMDACIAEEINPATAATQYSKWKKAKEGGSN